MRVHFVWFMTWNNQLGSTILTRMYSSRMRTVRCSGHLSCHACPHHAHLPSHTCPPCQTYPPPHMPPCHACPLCYVCPFIMHGPLHRACPSLPHMPPFTPLPHTHDRRLWNQYLSATTVADGNYVPLTIVARHSSSISRGVIFYEVFHFDSHFKAICNYEVTQDRRNSPKTETK